MQVGCWCCWLVVGYDRRWASAVTVLVADTIGASMGKRSPKHEKVDENKGKQSPERCQSDSGAKGLASSTKGSYLVNRK